LSSTTTVLFLALTLVNFSI